MKCRQHEKPEGAEESAGCIRQLNQWGGKKLSGPVQADVDPGATSCSNLSLVHQYASSGGIRFRINHYRNFVSLFIMRQFCEAISVALRCFLTSGLMASRERCAYQRLRAEWTEISSPSRITPSLISCRPDFTFCKGAYVAVPEVSPDQLPAFSSQFRWSRRISAVAGRIHGPISSFLTFPTCQSKPAASRRERRDTVTAVSGITSPLLSFLGLFLCRAGDDMPTVCNPRSQNSQVQPYCVRSSRCFSGRNLYLRPTLWLFST